MSTTGSSSTSRASLKVNLKYDIFANNKKRDKRNAQRRELTPMERSIVSCNIYPYDRCITLKSEYMGGTQPKYKIPIVMSSKETLQRPHDLILMVPGDTGSNRFPVGNSICIGTFPDRKTALEKKKQIKSEFSGRDLSSPNARATLGRGDWNVDQEMVVKPSSLMKQDSKQVTTGKVTSRKNCECPFRC